MTAELQVLLQSRCRREVLRAAALLGACLLVAIAAVLFATSSRARADNEYMEEQGLAAAAQVGTTGAEVAATLPQLVAETARLQRAGFDKPADRVAWVDTAVRALDRLHPVAYTVEAGVAQIQPAGGRLQQRYEEAGLEAPQLERTDLLLRVQGLQEDELLHVIEQVVAAGGAVVRVEHCKLGRRADGAGLDAECRLGRYSLRRAETAP